MIVRKNKYGFKIHKEVWYLFLNGYINTIQSIIIKASTKLIEEFREECEEEYLKTFV